MSSIPTNSTSSGVDSAIGNPFVAVYVVAVWVGITISLCLMLWLRAKFVQMYNNQQQQDQEQNMQARRRDDMAVHSRGRMNGGKVGLPREEIEKIREFTHLSANTCTGSRCSYSEEELGELAAAPQCVICLSNFVNGDSCRELPPPCCHMFHKRCIDDWLSRSSRCPLCSRSIPKLLESSSAIASTEEGNQEESLCPPSHPTAAIEAPLTSEEQV